MFTVNDLAETVCREFGIKPNINYLQARKEVLHAYSDHSKVQKVFQYQKKSSLQNGIHAMAEWAKKVGVRKSKMFENIEIMRILPPSWLE